MLRRTVPNDNSCLFYAIAYCCEGEEASRPVEQRLRKIVADSVLADPDPDTRAVFLGKPVAEYAEWIMNTHHWGGENEVVVLAEHFKVEVAVVSCEMMSTIVYGENPSATGRIYLLYTGQHYDPLVGNPAGDPDCPKTTEVKRHEVGYNATLDTACLAIAKKHMEDAARKAAQKRVKKIKCGGCDALLDNSQAFQEHCMEVEHGDDFAYDCSEVEVVYEEGEAVPEGTVDLTDQSKVFTFYNTHAYSFSNFYPAAVTVDGIAYPTAEHAWLSLQYAGSDLAAKIQKAATIDEAQTLAFQEGMNQQRPDWQDSKFDAMLSIVRAKFTQHSNLRQELLDTGDKMIVNVDADQWAGMSAAGGIATGRNQMGVALQLIREQIRAES